MRTIFRSASLYARDTDAYKCDYLEFVLTILGYQSHSSGIEMFMFKKQKNGLVKVCYFEDEGYVTWDEFDE